MEYQVLYKNSSGEVIRTESCESVSKAKERGDYIVSSKPIVESFEIKFKGRTLFRGNERKIVEKLILEEPQDEEEVQENEEEVEVEENEDEIEVQENEDETEVDEQEVEVEEQEVEEDEPSREDEDRAVLSALTYAIQGCWARVDEYNSIIASLSDMDFAEAQEIADILRDVTNSVLVSVGQLEKAIGIVSPQAELNVETGRNSEVEEEQEEVESDEVASDDEEVIDEVETTEVEEEEEMLPLEK